MKSILLTKQLLKNMNELELTDLALENQNRPYEGASFWVNNIHFRSRMAKLTPKKPGYFVTLWEKGSDGKNQPFKYEECPDKIIISIIDGNLNGQFIFNKDILLEKGVLRSEDTEGKMAVRVYPSWISDLNPSASKTKEWQNEYFVDLTDECPQERIKELYLS
ncbi:MepB family protein [Corticicoccus populi]|uniref:MepB family protein n=1 Tax=Corticicoccus populi TaxID=1812821 RepID=A0ABW5WTF6_9STAP